MLIAAYHLTERLVSFPCCGADRSGTSCGQPCLTPLTSSHWPGCVSNRTRERHRTTALTWKAACCAGLWQAVCRRFHRCQLCRWAMSDIAHILPTIMPACRLQQGGHRTACFASCCQCSAWSHISQDSHAGPWAALSILAAACSLADWRRSSMLCMRHKPQVWCSCKRTWTSVPSLRPS